MCKNTEVVITGISTISPLGYEYCEILDKIKNSKDGYQNDKTFKIHPDDYATVTNLYDTGERSINIALFTFKRALTNACLSEKDIPDNSFIVYSSSKGGLSSLLDAAVNNRNYAANLFNYFPSAALSYICADIIKKNIPSLCLVSACSTGLYSIIRAYNAILEGADMAFAGTTESSIIPPVYNGFKNMRVFAKGKNMPFDLKRDGFIMGEGAGTFVLESKEHAIMRGAKILAKIDGYGMTTDPSHITSLDTGGEQIKNAISKAMGKVKDLSWINVHGTGTLINDLAEYNALKSYFKESLDDIYINSFKPYTGHLLGASSTVETAFCIMCMNERILPENLNLKEPTFNLKLKTDKRQGVKINNVLKLSHGFGGHIGALLISEAD